MTNSDLVLGDDGNFFRVASTELINRVVPGVRSGTQIVLYFADAVTGATCSSPELNATPGSMLSLVALGDDWLELSRSINSGHDDEDVV